MKVKLISVTPNALELLVGTKTTRMRGKQPQEMTQEELYEHFEYMLDTIKSPFEFVDYIFEITEVSKNFTHQLVRTRTGAYQQETSRALEVDATASIRPAAFEYPGEAAGDMAQPGYVQRETLARQWDDATATVDALYKELISAGAELQDARAILPTNMPTAIKAKFNLRTLSDMARNRLCRRTQGEYQAVYRAMRELIVAEHPWADPLLQVACVATGQCAFPRWGSVVLQADKGDARVAASSGIGLSKEGGEWEWNCESEKFESYQCDMYRPWMDLSKERNELRKVFWLSEVINANPVAKDGKSM